MSATDLIARFSMLPDADIKHDTHNNTVSILAYKEYRNRLIAYAMDNGYDFEVRSVPAYNVRITFYLN